MPEKYSAIKSIHYSPQWCQAVGRMASKTTKYYDGGEQLEQLTPACEQLRVKVLPLQQYKASSRSSSIQKFCGLN